MISSLADRERIRRLVHEAEQKWGGQPHLRRAQFDKLRNKYLIAYVTQRLGALPEHRQKSVDQLRRMASAIVAKAGASTSAPPQEKRTGEEEKMIGAGQVSWHKLLKAEGVTAARPWSRKSQNIRLKSSPDLIRSLLEPGVDAERGQVLLCEYVANQALHLLNVLEQAKSINPEFFTREVHNYIVQLYVASSK